MLVMQNIAEEAMQNHCIDQSIRGISEGFICQFLPIYCPSWVRIYPMED